MGIRGEIRVVIADDHELFRRGIAEMLATAGNISVVGEAGDFERAVAIASKLKPDLVLLDLEMPGMGAKEALQQMMGFKTPPRVIVLTMHDEARLAREFIGLGAASYLTKSISLERLVETVREVAQVPLAPEGDEDARVIQEEVLDDLEREADGLSPREVEILLQAARGMSNRQAAISLHLSEATIKRHLANIYKKLRVGSRSEATRLALANNWISSYEISDKRKDGRRDGQ